MPTLDNPTREKQIEPGFSPKPARLPKRILLAEAPTPSPSLDPEVPTPSPDGD